MDERETPHAIAEEAIAWVARIDRAPLSAEAQDEFDAWLAADQRREGAFFRAQSAWHMLDRASVLGAGQEASNIGGNADFHHRSKRLSISRRGFVISGAMAASLVAGIAAYSTWTDQPQRIETAVGEIRRVPLPDGSLAAVNTETAIAIRLRPGLRNVALDQGEAWFQVAKDHKRPFVVEAGDVRVRAVGTAFSVRRFEKGAEVQVTEGVVEVWRVGDEAGKQRISAGSRSFVSYDSAPIAEVAVGEQIDRKLAWRQGQLIFDGDTLGEAIAEFNRYNVVKVEVADPVLAQERLVGRFRTNEPDAFARAAAGMLNAHAERRAERISLTR